MYSFDCDYSDAKWILLSNRLVEQLMKGSCSAITIQPFMVVFVDSRIMLYWNSKDQLDVVANLLLNDVHTTNLDFQCTRLNAGTVACSAPNRFLENF